MNYIPSTDEIYPSGFYAAYYEQETLGPECPECHSGDTRCINTDYDLWVCERCGVEFETEIPF